VSERLGLEAGAEVVVRRLRFLVDDEPVQLVKVYYDPGSRQAVNLNDPSSSRMASTPNCDDSVCR